jgi:hypothetical protein
MDPNTPVGVPDAPSDALEFVRFCYRRRRVGWPELYDEMCAVAGRGLYRGWRFAELEDRGIGFSLSQTLELARIAGQVAEEEGDRRVRVTGKASARATDRLVGIPVEAGPVPAPTGRPTPGAGPEERVIEVRIVTHAPPLEDAAAADATGARTPLPLVEPAVASSPSRPALAPSLIRSAAGAG